jgi:hypothetical protein
MIRTAAVFLAVATLGCGVKDTPDVNPPDADGAAVGAAALASSVEVEVHANTVRMVLHVTNPTSRPVTLEFSSGQRYDFAIRTAAGADVWTWSADKLFAQMVGTETIAPGATLDYTETWTPAGQKGSFVAIARLASTSHPVREQAAFQIP